MQLDKAKLMMKLYAKHPPRKNAVEVMVINPVRAKKGNRTRLDTKANPMICPRNGFFLKRYLHTARR